ncbi:MAG: UbiA family prenyltransferase [Planctomycetaceae bacterium]|jgi:4-hydroxybenzoate polyprenyltransferase|nr:UbiA family prenyltransferase [Planctomycetaceae bacterium]
MWSRLKTLLEMIRFSHTVFALPFALLSAVMCWTVPDFQGLVPSFVALDLLGIVLCMVFARSAAMAFNRVADWRIDAENPRTAARHIPAGELSLSSAVWFTVLNCAMFVAATLLFLPNQLPIILSLPVLGLLGLYSYTKRFTSLAHFYLGASLLLAPVCTWIALRGEILQHNMLDIVPAVVLGLIVMFWVGGFDIIYACQDTEFDQQAKLKSIPARFGVRGALRIAAVSHLLMIVAMVGLAFVSQLDALGWIYYVTVAAVGVLLTIEHCLVKPDDLARVNIAFFQINALISIGLFLIVSLDLLL